MDSDSRYISKEFNSFQVISALDILQQFHKSDNRDYSVPLSNALSLSAWLFVRHPCTVVTLPMSDLEPFGSPDMKERTQRWHVASLSVLVKSRVFLTCNWYYPRVGPPFPVAPATPSPASLSMRMLTKFRHLQSSGGGIRSQRATETLRRHDKSPPSTLALCFSPTLNVFSVSPQPRDQLVSTSNAFVLGASRSTRGVNETLCLWASRALRVPLVCQTQPSTLLW